MDTNNLEYILTRLDSAISNTNSKSTLILGIDTFLLGALITNYNYISSQLLEYMKLVNVSIIAILISLIIAIISIIPIFKSNKANDVKDSIIFFGKIAEKTSEEIFQLATDSEYNYTKDLCEQISEIGSISNSKYKSQKFSLVMLVIFAVLPWTLIFLDKLMGGTI